MSTEHPEHHQKRFFFSAARRCWPGLIISSSSLFTSERDVLLRRKCMIDTLSLHNPVSILVILAVASKLSIIPRIIFSILGFFITACSSSLIDRTRGVRRAAGSICTRWHFDAFLCILFLWNHFLVGWAFAEIGAFALYDLWWTLFWAVDLVLWVAAWVAWWPQEDGTIMVYAQLAD